MANFPAKVDIKYEQKASRLELFIRMIMLIAYGIVAFFWGIAVVIVWTILWIYILITGKREVAMTKFIIRYWRFITRVGAYDLLLTDERPPLDGNA
jgi:hypothetical protein